MTVLTLTLSACSTSSGRAAGSGGPAVIDATGRHSAAAPGRSGRRTAAAAQDYGRVHPYVPDQNGVQSTAGQSSQTAVYPAAAAEAAPVKHDGFRATDGVYVVQPKDTLYAIAFHFDRDYRELAEENGIRPPYDIKVGQKIRVRAQKKPAGSSKIISYKVKTGDSVNSVARAYHSDVKSIVSLNALKAPYYLKRGQVIRVPVGTAGARTTESAVAGTARTAQTAHGGSGRSAQAGTADHVEKVEVTQTTTPGGTVIKETVVTVKENPVPRDTEVVPGKTRTVSGVAWRWPAKGKVIRTFSSSGSGSKGIDIAGERGQQVMAAADGQVVYAGSALRGYGNLLIINHANEYLSAYAHNDELLVKEGQSVKRGQVIARMGATDADRVKLHFEIRNKGTSVNPQNYLP